METASNYVPYVNNRPMPDYVRNSIKYFCSFGEENVVCPSCLSEFSEVLLPYGLSCGHSICEICLTDILENRKKCPDCQIPFAYPKKGDYQLNLQLIEMLTFLREAHSSQKINFENLCSSVCERFLKRTNDVLNLLPTWDELVSTGIGMLMNTTFWKDEMSRTNGLVQKETNVSISAQGLKHLFRILAESESIGQEYSLSWKSELEFLNSGTIINTKNYLHADNKSTFKAILTNHPYNCWAFKEVDGEEMYFKLTAAEDQLHIHCQETPILGCRPFLFQFDSISKLLKREETMAFLEVWWVNGENKGEVGVKPVLLYIQLEITEDILWHHTRSLFLGDKGIGFKNCKLEKNLSTATVRHYVKGSRLQQIPNIFGLPDDSIPFEQDSLRVGDVVGLRDYHSGPMEIIMESDKRNFNVSFGKVISGMDYLIHLMDWREVYVVDCGLSSIIKKI